MLTPDDCSRILETLLSTGADGAEIYQEKVHRLRLVVDDGSPDSALAGNDGGVALSLFQEDRIFSTNGNDTDPAAVLAAAVRLAASLNGAPQRAPATWWRPPGTSPSPIQIPPRTIAPEQKMNLLLRADRHARGMDSRVDQVAVRYLETVQEILVARSEGDLARDHRTLLTLAVTIMAREGDEIGTGHAVASEARGFELFDEHPPEETAGEAARLALVQLAARPAPAGTFTVVLSSRAGGTMVHEACGHGLEGDFVEKGLSAYAGRLGEMVASRLVSVVDDGTRPHARGSCFIDDEAVPTQRVVLIQDGRLKGFLHSRQSARRMQVPSTGNGRRESFRHLPIPRMRNTMIVPGKTAPEEIVASVKDGLFIASMGGGEVDIASGHFVFNCPEAYRIRNGRIAEPLRDVTLAGSGPEVLRTIDMVGSDLGFQVGTCGKDGQGVPVADAQPTLRIPSLVVGGQAASR
ncbi:MAG: TldD/PmbA family protein [Acidobacteriota bacterium]